METINLLTHAENVLTERELEVYIGLGQGKSPTQIGKELFISSKTISTHRGNIMRKMGFKNTYELMYHSIKSDLSMNGKE